MSDIRVQVVRCDECDGHGCPDCNETGKRKANYECRRCSDCRGEQHHWIEDCGDDDDDGQFYACKHCDATANACGNCSSPVQGQYCSTSCEEEAADAAIPEEG